jgi:adenylate cyclase
MLRRPNPGPWDHWPMDTAAWERAGLYQPGMPEADERLALLEYLTARGATIEQMVEAHGLGSLPAVAGDLVLGADPATLSIEEIAAHSGVPVERVQRVLLAAGLPVAADSTFPESLELFMAAFEQAVALMGEDAILAFTRVLGAAATNIAEAAVALFYAELGPGTGREGEDELARAKVAEMATLAFTTVPEVLPRLLLVQFERAVHRGVLARGWATPGGAGAEPAAALGEVVALGFVDLVGSTPWSASLSLREQSLALSRFESAAWSSAVLAEGRVVKMIGDEAFFTAPSVDAACRIAIEVCRAAAEDPLLPLARGAVGYGPVTPREGDYFGPLVNLVSRLVKAPEPGAVAVTEEAAELLHNDRWKLRELDVPPLRGVEQPVRAFVVTDRGGDGTMGA